MSAVTQAISSSRNGLRPFDINRDLESVANLVEACFTETLDEDGKRYVQQMHSAARNPRYLRWATAVAEQVSLPLSGYVWEQDGSLVGNLNLIPFTLHARPSYLIANVAVDPAYRGRGIARALTSAAMQHAGDRGIKTVWLHVREENLPALQLYLSLGFVERARRATWEIKPTSSKFTVSPNPEVPTGFMLTSPQARDWPPMRAWLQNTYPPELTWHLPYSLNSLRPGLGGTVFRILTGTKVRQWAALDGRRLCGVLSWQPRLNHADQLWLACTPEHEDRTIAALLSYARAKLADRRRMLLDYPAGRGKASFQEAGFHLQQILIWMETQLNQTA